MYVSILVATLSLTLNVCLEDGSNCHPPLPPTVSHYSYCTQ